jgi:hypothetical protein
MLCYFAPTITALNVNPAARHDSSNPGGVVASCNDVIGFVMENLRRMLAILIRPNPLASRPFGKSSLVLDGFLIYKRRVI